MEEGEKYRHTAVRSEIFKFLFSKTHVGANGEFQTHAHSLILPFLLLLPERTFWSFKRTNQINLLLRIFY